MNIIKPTANLVALNTQNTVYWSAIVYISATVSSQINLYSNSTTQYASFVLPTNQTIFVVKEPSHLISANNTVWATPASYRG